MKQWHDQTNSAPYFLSKLKKQIIMKRNHHNPPDPVGNKKDPGTKGTAGFNWVDNRDVCNLFHISMRTLARYRRKGVLPYSKIEKRVFYHMNDIDDYLKTHKIRKVYSSPGR
jgi:hypothetical protein